MSPPGFGGQGYTDPQTRTLRSIYEAPERQPTGSKEIAQMLQSHEAQLRFLAQNQKQMAKDVEKATQNPIQQIQQFIADILVLLGGGELAQGALDFGDLQYILPALGALFGFGDSPFPLNLIAAAEKFFFGYVVPTQAFTDLLNNFIGNWLETFGIDKKFIKDVKALVTAVGELFDGVTGLLPNVNQFFSALGITASGLGPLGVALAPIIKLFQGIDLAAFGNAVEFITNAIDPWIVQLTSSINFINALLHIFGAGGDVLNSPLPQLTVPFANLVKFLGGVNLAITSFNPILAAQQFIGRLLIPLGSISTVQPNLQLDPGFDESSSIAEDSPAWAPQDLDPLIDYPEGWLWDLIGRTAAGSATVECDGNANGHGLLGTVIPVDEGQTFTAECWLTWSGLTATGFPFVLQVVTDSGGVADIASVASPGASGGWTQLTGNYTVPSGVETIRIRLFVASTATAGQVWFDDATIRRTSLMQKGFVAGLVDNLDTIFGYFATLLDGVLGTGHTFEDLADAIATGLGQAATAIDNFTTILTNAGGLTVAAFGTLIANLNTMLTQISDIFNGATITPLNTVVTQIQDWWNANTAYLQDIPNTAVQGVIGFGADIGASVQALSDAAWQGLRAFLGVPSGVGPPQVASAGQQVRVDLNNASDIAAASAAVIANQAITKQSFLAIDPSADPVFPLSNITGSSPSTVSVTQAKSVMGAIGLPDAGTKKSVVWLGGSLTNITAVYVNLYKVDTTTGALTQTHASANIIGSLSNPGSGVAWNFYNLPSTAFFATAQGDWYVAEIVVTGTGTYSVVGISNSWMPNHPTVFPKSLGNSRVPLAFDAATTANNASVNGLGNSGAGTLSTTQTIAAGATVAVLVAHANCSAGTPAYSAKIGTTPMTLAASIANLGGGAHNDLLIYLLYNPPTGSQTVSFTQANAGTTWGVSYGFDSYIGPTGNRTAQSASGTSASIALTCTSGQPGDLIICGIAAFQTGLGSFNKNSRASVTAGGTDPVLLGDANGDTSVALSASQSASAAYGIIALPLTVTPPSSIASPTSDSNVPWIALAGAAGRSEHPPETVEFETAGAGQTYTVPAWIEDGDYFNIVACGSGAGGSYNGNYPSGFDSSYKAGGAGQWNPVQLRYGDAYDIPTGTTTFTVNVAAGGSGAPYPGTSYTPGHGSDGADTTVVISGYPTITAIGGLHDASAAGSAPAFQGGSPGNEEFEGVTYFGGAVSTSAGNDPGGGGGSGWSLHIAGQNRDLSGGNGAPGAVIITAVQN